MIYVNGEAVGVATQFSAKEVTPDYVTSGLIALFDGIKNTADGHSDRPSAWKDLSGNDRDLVTDIANVFLSDSCFFNASGLPMTYTNNEMPTVKAVEIVLSNCGFTNSAMIAQFNRSKKGIYRKENSVMFNTGVNGFEVDLTTRKSIYYDFDNDKCYVNGVEVAHNTVTASWSYSYSRDILLADYNSTANDYKGEICCLRLYSQALTAEQRLHNYAIDKYRFGIEEAV